MTRMEIRIPIRSAPSQNVFRSKQRPSFGNAFGVTVTGYCFCCCWPLAYCPLDPAQSRPQMDSSHSLRTPTWSGTDSGWQNSKLNLADARLDPASFLRLVAVVAPHTYLAFFFSGAANAMTIFVRINSRMHSTPEDAMRAVPINGPRSWLACCAESRGKKSLIDDDILGDERGPHADATITGGKSGYPH